MSKVLRLIILSALFMCWFSIASADAFRSGDQGTEVAEIQGALANLGYDVAADGDFGPATQEAVKEFQASMGIDADGLVGSQTYQALMGRDMPQVSRGSNYYTRRIIQTSLQYIGVPYVFGGTTPSGFDCSGFTRYVFANAGISLPRTADAQYEVGTPVAYDDLIPGDLVFFSTYTYGASHVGVYMGDSKFIDASTSRGVTIDSLDSGYWSSAYIGARRII
ncbi:C40 family peptidase [Pectinatus cerevisiiphilus]|uniref:Cell wall-associated NlpC family hydrolase n=1 Tax=Pectinatus cerevisiiphilus TaxID=86956 RepID=A0A4R3K430_9FIRM|nr:NlpC/P60 family protein [Pectinatus cerevisiiphilus]TCS77509.1 cell wall-associated NlpC family hydrolase [Pectinatus cerevisiiphilus]